MTNPGPMFSPGHPSNLGPTDAEWILKELVAALERHGFHVLRNRPHAVVDFPFVRIVAGPVDLAAVTLGNFAVPVARRLTNLLNSAPQLPTGSLATPAGPGQAGPHGDGPSRQQTRRPAR